MKKTTFAIFSISAFLSYSATAQVQVVVTAPLPHPVIVINPRPQPVIVIDSRPAPVKIKKKKKGHAYGHNKRRKD